MHVARPINVQLKPTNSYEHAKRSSRSGSLVSTPEHHANVVPTGQLLAFDSEQKLDVINDFDTVPNVIIYFEYLFYVIRGS